MLVCFFRRAADDDIVAFDHAISYRLICALTATGEKLASILPQSARLLIANS